MARAYSDMFDESIKQIALHGNDDRPDGTGADMAIVLAERTRVICDLRTGEGQVPTFAELLARDTFGALELKNPHMLEAELLKVASTAMRWVTKIRMRRGKSNG